MTYRTYSNNSSENSFQRKQNSGALFRNQKKQQPQHADFSGTLDVNGVQYWIDAWTRESKCGTKFLSLGIKLKGASKSAGTADDVF
jgi:hypothetical protein